MSDRKIHTYEEVLQSEGRLVAINSGRSMLPLLREGRDLMVIDKKGEARCRKYDAVLYKRGGRYILHRVVKVRESDYVIIGDNCRRLEYGITDSDILGTLTAVVRDGKREVRMDSKRARLYAHIWCDALPLRIAIFTLRDAARRVLGKIKRIIKPPKR